MSKEKVILSIVAALLGLSVAGGAFYIYQMTRTIDEPKERETTSLIQPSPSPQSTDYLIVDNPKDEEVVDGRQITVSGKTLPGSTIIVSSDVADEVLKAADNGNFTTTHTIGEGVTVIRITAVFPSGEEQSITRTVSFTTEDF
jgi:hypothetical protein